MYETFLTEAKSKKVEIRFNPSPSAREVSRAWTNNLEYRSNNVYEFYMDFLGWFEGKTRELKDASWSETMTDEVMDDDGNWVEDEWEEEVTREKQESYLGYIPSDDQFVTGFDLWEGEDNPAGIVYWRYIKGKFAIIDEKIDYSSSMMYGKSGAYKKLHKKHKDLIDIRLD